MCNPTITPAIAATGSSNGRATAKSCRHNTFEHCNRLTGCNRYKKVQICIKVPFHVSFISILNGNSGCSVHIGLSVTDVHFFISTPASMSIDLAEYQRQYPLLIITCISFTIHNAALLLTHSCQHSCHLNFTLPMYQFSDMSTCDLQTYCPLHCPGYREPMSVICSHLFRNINPYKPTRVQHIPRFLQL